jgi:hypothetical protein
MFAAESTANMHTDAVMAILLLAQRGWLAQVRESREGAKAQNIRPNENKEDVLKYLTRE